MENSNEAAPRYEAAWRERVACSDGPVAGSTLSVGELGLQSVSYTVSLAKGRGHQCYEDLRKRRARVAAALGVPVECCVFERTEDVRQVRLTIANPGVLEQPRLFRGPHVVKGSIGGLGRRVDSGEDFGLAMWHELGTVATALVGAPGTGRTNALRMLARSAGATGVMHTLYVDPSGVGDSVLRRRARVALTGKRAPELALELVQAIVRARLDYMSEYEFDRLLPSYPLGGWMLALESIGATVNRASEPAWYNALTDGAKAGLWPVAVAHDFTLATWVRERLRAMFLGQVVAFWQPRGALVPAAAGLHFSPSELPVDGAGRPVPGYVTTGPGWRRSGVPMRLDVLPDELEGEAAKPWEGGVDSNFDALSLQAELSGVDERAIVSVLGPAGDGGRWDVGSERTHERRDDWRRRANEHVAVALPAAAGAATLKPPQPRTEAELTQSARTVLALVRDGARSVGEVQKRSNLSRSTVQKALEVLQVSGFVAKVDDDWVPAEAAAVSAGTLPAGAGAPV